MRFTLLVCTGISAICLLLAITSSVAFSLKKPTKVAAKTSPSLSIHSKPTFLNAEGEASTNLVAAATPAPAKVTKYLKYKLKILSTNNTLKITKHFCLHHSTKHLYIYTFMYSPPNIFKEVRDLVIYFSLASVIIVSYIIHPYKYVSVSLRVVSDILEC